MFLRTVDDVVVTGYAADLLGVDDWTRCGADVEDIDGRMPCNFLHVIVAFMVFFHDLRLFCKQINKILYIYIYTYIHIYRPMMMINCLQYPYIHEYCEYKGNENLLILIW